MLFIFYSALNPSVISGLLNSIEPLNGTNFPTWKEQISINLGVMDLDYALRGKAPVPLSSDDENLAERTKVYEANKEKWERSNRLSLMIMKSTITLGIRGAIPDSECAKTYLASVEEQFKGSTKVYASTLIMKMLTTKYDGKSGVREHIMTMNDMAAKLKGMDMEISEGFLVHFIMTSLPMKYGPFKINYNTQKEKWTMSELTSMCVQEEERLKVERIDYAHLTSINSGKRKSQGDWKPKKKMNFSNTNASKPGTSSTKVIPTERKGPKCHFCKEDGHVMKECDGFKAWLAKKGNDSIS
jgi:hypothetical protein